MNHLGLGISADTNFLFREVNTVREKNIRSEQIKLLMRYLHTALHMAILGADGLARVATACIKNTQKLVDALTAIDGISVVFNGPRFHEAAIRIANVDVEAVIQAMTDRGIIPGFYLGEHYPELTDALLVCATEMRTDEDITLYVETLKDILSQPGGEEN